MTQLTARELMTLLQDNEHTPTPQGYTTTSSLIEAGVEGSPKMQARITTPQREPGSEPGTETDRMSTVDEAEEEMGRKSETNENTTECTICYKEIDDNDWDQHRETEHPSALQCEMCHSLSTTHTDLALHISGRHLQCDQCHFYTNQEQDLQDHMDDCHPPGWGGQGTTLEGQEQEERKFTYVCTECNIQTQDKHTFIRHEAAVHKTCTLCNNIFGDEEEVLHHIRGQHFPNDEPLFRRIDATMRRQMRQTPQPQAGNPQQKGPRSQGSRQGVQNAPGPAQHGGPHGSTTTSQGRSNPIPQRNLFGPGPTQRVLQNKTGS